MKKYLMIVALFTGMNASLTSYASELTEEIPYVSVENITAPRLYTYLGVEGGFGMTHWKMFNENNSVTKDNGVVGRAFLGIDFNKYFAIETGYTHFFNKARYSVNDSSYNEMTTYVFDLLGKFKVPVADDTSFYAKFGADYLNTKISTTGYNINLMGSETRHELDIAYGLGIDYAITPHVVLNLEWLRLGGRIKVKNNNSNVNIQPYTDTFMAGIKYRFDI